MKNIALAGLFFSLLISCTWTKKEKNTGDFFVGDWQSKILKEYYSVNLDFHKNGTGTFAIYFYKNDVTSSKCSCPITWTIDGAIKDYTEGRVNLNIDIYTGDVNCSEKSEVLAFESAFHEFVSSNAQSAFGLKDNFMQLALKKIPDEDRIGIGSITLEKQSSETKH